VDLGCGGGDLCVEAAHAGFDVIGVDVAEGMIAAAGDRRRRLSPSLQERLTYRIGEAVASGLPGREADVVTALGLLEYLDGDDAFFREAARLLRPGGVLVVSCRNRLFNMASLNEYTRAELEAGAGARLLDELAALAPRRDARAPLAGLVEGLGAALPGLAEALAEDLRRPPEPSGAAGFAQPRRQHTPREVSAAGERAGFTAATFVGVHPHPLLPAFEAVAPRFYNRLAAVWDALASMPASLAWSSAFLAVLSRCPR
jgi:SAM-dependent methyltransferase